MPDPFAKLTPGSRLKLQSESWNALIDAAKVNRASQGGMVGGPATIGRDNGVIKLRNDSGASRARFDVLGLGDPIILPATNEDGFLRKIGFAGETPASADHASKFAILLAPLASGAIGDALVSGVVQCPINVDAESGDYASVTDGEYTLTRGSSAGAEILWVESGTGDGKWSVLRLGSGSAAASAAAFSGARVSSPSPATIASSTITAIGFISETYDTDSYHSNVTNNTRLTVPSTGYYHIGGWLSMSAPTTPGTYWRYMGIRVDGTTVYGTSQDYSTSSASYPLFNKVVSIDLSLTSGHYVELIGYQESGSTPSINADFWIHKLG